MAVHAAAAAGANGQYAPLGAAAGVEICRRKRKRNGVVTATGARCLVSGGGRVRAERRVRTRHAIRGGSASLLRCCREASSDGAHDALSWQTQSVGAPLRAARARLALCSTPLRARLRARRCYNVVLCSRRLATEHIARASVAYTPSRRGRRRECGAHVAAARCPLCACKRWQLPRVPRMRTCVAWPRSRMSHPDAIARARAGLGCCRISSRVWTSCT